MIESQSLVDELIKERRIEEFRENIQDALRLGAEEVKFRRLAARAYIGLAGIWVLDQSDAATLLNLSDQDYQDWQEGEFTDLGVDHLEKISCLLGIYRYLFTLYSGHTDRVSAWLCRSNAGVLIAGNTPYEILAGARVEVFHLVRRKLAGATA